MLIGELAERTRVSRRSLRYYEEQGLLVPERGPNGYRQYAVDAPLVVEQIQGLYASGLDSDAVRQYLPCARGRTPRLELCDSLRAYLEARAAELDAQTAAIARQRERVQAHLGHEPRLASGARTRRADRAPTASPQTRPASASAAAS